MSVRTPCGRRTGAVRSRLLASCLLLFLMPAGQAEVFKWTDAQGRVHFSDQPPADAAAEQVRLRINTYESAAVVPGGAAASGDGKVVMYSTSWCGVCKKARAYFKENRIAFTEYDVEKSDQGRREYARLGARGVPVILVGTARMNGFSPDGFRRLYGAR